MKKQHEVNSGQMKAYNVRVGDSIILVRGEIRRADPLIGELMSCSIFYTSP